MKCILNLAAGVMVLMMPRLAVEARAQEEGLPEGVTAKVVTYYSEHVACYGRIFFPKDFVPGGKTPGVVLANGWTGTAGTLERYAAQFAARGLVAMTIDYRGWGRSGAFVRLAEPIKQDDRLRFAPFTARVRLKRTRLLPEAQIEDIRNAISYLQGERGVNPDRIGLWGTSYAGGHVITVAGRDARVKVAVCQVPAISGKNVPVEAFRLTGNLLEDAIRRARTGQGGTYESGFSRKVTLDLETRQAAAEYRPFHEIPDIPASVPILFVIAENEELMSNEDHARAAAAALEGQGNTVKVLEIPDITYLQIHRGKAFRTGSQAAADWFVEHLNAN